MTVELAKDVEEFLQQQVSKGVCSDASELVNDVLRALRGPQTKPFEMTSGLESWLLEAADSATTPLGREDFQAIRERVRKRVAPAP